MRVNLPHAGGSQLVFSAVTCLLFGTVGVLAQDKVIRLRNETISTPPKIAAALQPRTVESPATGLFLVQFNDGLQPAWREQLRQMRVELVRYVPDDAFIARFNNVSPASIGALSFVHWVGSYRPEHKIHPQLVAAATAAARTNETVSVNILLSSSATAAEIAAARSDMAVVYHESHLRQGIVVRGELLPRRLDALSRSSAVLWIERAPKRKLVDEAASKLVGGDDGRKTCPDLAGCAGPQSQARSTTCRICANHQRARVEQRRRRISGRNWLSNLISNCCPFISCLSICAETNERGQTNAVQARERFFSAEQGRVWPRNWHYPCGKPSLCLVKRRFLNSLCG